MDVTDCNHGDTGHGNNELPVFLDALDVAFGPFVDAVGHADAVADVILRRIGSEILDIPAGVGGCHQDERVHLLIADGARLPALGFGVIHEILIVAALEFAKPLLAATHEKQRRDQLLLNIGQAAAVELLHGMDRDICFHTLVFKQGFNIHDPVIEHLEGVPVKAIRRGFD